MRCVDEPTTIFQVKSANAAECKVHRCITRKLRAQHFFHDTWIQEKEDREKERVKKNKYIHTHIFFYIVAINDYVVT